MSKRVLHRARVILGFPGLVFCLLSALSVQATAEEGSAEAGKTQSDQQEKQNDYFAVIDGEKIPIDEFLYTFRRGVREKFYHGKVSRDKVENFKNEVADKLVTKILLVKEAKRRGLKADEKDISHRLDEIDQKFKKSKDEKEREAWGKDRGKTLTVIRQRMEADALTALLYEEVKKVSAISENELKAYYSSNKDKFTAPEQWDVSLILLSVDPSSSSEIWQSAIEEGQALVEKIREGANFDEMARIHSGDESAANGGNMGYLHIGMLSEPAQKVLNIMEVGQVSEPVVLLKGVAIFRLNGVRKARLNEFKKIKQSAKDLLEREKGDAAWQNLIASLRKSATVEYSDAIRLELNSVLDQGQSKGK
ncbi:MAG: peptidylprolyl isomerase [Gammaproteobacteria bacterium]|nr:peptidylprolyl isomerase [Gammaproteobacteria bacterium]MDH5800813.1 peptidylprolyl isomerase [Gammaproteobacteria bacterium]